MEQPPERFDDAGRRICAALRRGDSPDKADVALVLGVIRGALHARFGASGSHLVDDAVQTGFEGFLAAVRAENVDCAGHPGRYLLVSARNALNSELRRPYALPLEALDEESLAADDASLERVTDVVANRALLEQAMANAVQARDDEAARIAAVARDLLEECGRWPGSRRIAVAARTSHTSVNAALRRLRSYFPDEPAGA